MTIHIVTDSTSDLDPELANQYGITIVPLNVHFGNQTYKDGIDINTDDFFRKLTTGPDFPSTSQPSVGEFVNVYEKLGEKNDQILSIHISRKLSGTINSAELAAKQVGKNIIVSVIDTKQCSITIGFIALAAAKAAKANKSINEILEIINSTSMRSHVFVLLDTLEYLEKGGRIGKAKSLMGSLLKIKPMLRITDGEVDEFGKARSQSSGLIKLEQAIQSLGKIQDIGIIYSTNKEVALEFSNTLKAMLPNGPTPLIARVGPVIGTHAGPNMIGVAAITI